MYFSILGRIIRVTDSVIEYRRSLKELFPVSTNPEMLLNGSGSSDGENEEELDTSPDSSAPGSDSVRWYFKFHALLVAVFSRIQTESPLYFHFFKF